MRLALLAGPVVALATCCPRPQGAAPAAPLSSSPGAQPGVAEARAAWSPEALAGSTNLANVALSPDGAEAAFISDKSGALEVWTAHVKENVVGPLVQRTHQNENVSEITWSPDGAFLIFANDHGGDERQDLWILKNGAAEPERLTDSKVSEQEIQFSPDGKSIAYGVDRDRDFHFNVEVMDLATRKTRQLTHESITLLSPRWSRDGKTIVAVRTADEGQKGDLFVVDVATSKTRVIPAPRKDGVLTPEGFLLDGRVVARATNDAGFLQIALVNLETGKVSRAGPADWDVEKALALDDGSILFSRNVHGESEVVIAAGPRPFETPSRVLHKGGVLEALAADRAVNMVLALRETASRPTEAITLDPHGASVKLAVPAELPGVDLATLAAAERIEVKSFDGTPIDAFVWMPPVRRMGLVPPLVVWVHGGPNAQSRGTFSPILEAFAEAGLAVITVNYRGSTGYGRAFEDLNNKDWGGGDLKDILAVVGHLVKENKVDGSRVGIVGGSYGGYMALRAITAEPDVFKAAIDMYGMPDLVQDYALTEDRFGSWYETEMGTPAKDAALYKDRSPIHALDRVKTPLLVLQGANDSNVPRAESDLVVEALKKRQQPVEYTVYPNEGHGFTHRENRVDSYRKSVEFFTRTLKPQPRPGAR